MRPVNRKVKPSIAIIWKQLSNGCRLVNSFWIISVFEHPPPPPRLVAAYYLHLPDARAIFLNKDLLCNRTCFVTKGAKHTVGGTNGKDPSF